MPSRPKKHRDMGCEYYYSLTGTEKLEMFAETNVCKFVILRYFTLKFVISCLSLSKNCEYTPLFTSLTLCFLTYSVP